VSVKKREDCDFLNEHHIGPEENTPSSTWRKREDRANTSEVKKPKPWRRTPIITLKGGSRDQEAETKKSISLIKNGREKTQNTTRPRNEEEQTILGTLRFIFLKEEERVPELRQTKGKMGCLNKVNHEVKTKYMEWGDFIQKFIKLPRENWFFDGKANQGDFGD